MRHGKKFNHLGRKSAHRKALLRNLSIALITHKRIKTTLAKAKALRVHLEPIITKSKANNTHSRRVVFSYIQDKVATAELFGPIAEKVANRPGGYLRVIKTGFRQGDSAEMALIEFVDYNQAEYSPNDGTKTGTKKRRSRRGGGGQKAAAPAAPAAVATPSAKAEEEE
ncbi:MAG: 50S ribosomal protein L17 [Saprospiraceae bacterium]|nr:50S ribosomal protein L17 [Saprospiraceae bacterium]